MNIDELVALMNGLSVPCGSHMLVCDRTRVSPLEGDAVDVKFLIAGTDYVPRVRLRREQITRATADDISRIVRRVTCRATGATW